MFYGKELLDLEMKALREGLGAEEIARAEYLYGRRLLIKRTLQIIGVITIVVVGIRFAAVVGEYAEEDKLGLVVGSAGIAGAGFATMYLATMYIGVPSETGL